MKMIHNVLLEKNLVYKGKIASWDRKTDIVEFSFNPNFFDKNLERLFSIEVSHPGLLINGELTRCINKLDSIISKYGT